MLITLLLLVVVVVPEDTPVAVVVEDLELVVDSQYLQDQMQLLLVEAVWVQIIMTGPLQQVLEQILFLVLLHQLEAVVVASHQLPHRPEVLAVAAATATTADPEIHPQRHHHKEILEEVELLQVPLVVEVEVVQVGAVKMAFQELLVMADLDLLAVLAVLQLLMLVEVVVELLIQELLVMADLVVVVMVFLLGLRHKMELPTSVAVEAVEAVTHHQMLAVVPVVPVS